MKICINALLVEPNRTGGGETFLVNLVRRLARFDQNNEYLILVTTANRALFKTNNPKFETRVVLKSACPQWRRVAYEWLALPCLLWSWGVDLFYAPFGVLPPLVPCRSVVTFQNLIYIDFRKHVPQQGRGWRARLRIWLQYQYNSIAQRWTLRQADRIWAVSRTTAKVLQGRLGVDRRKITVVYEGVDYGAFSPDRRERAMSVTPSAPYIATVATLYPNKNIEKLIRAFAQLVAQGFPHEALVIGNDWHGHQRELELVARELGIAERVRFLGGVEHTRIPELLSGAQLFVLFSSVESFGLPVLEAMAAGVPVIISDSSALPEIAGGAAMLCRAGDVDHLAERLRQVLADRDLAATLRELGKTRARQFSWDETAVRAIDLFNGAAATSTSHQSKTIQEGSWA